MKVYCTLVAGMLAAAVALWLAQVVEAGPVPSVDLGAIQPPDHNKVFLVGHGVGVQIYACSATNTGFAWTFVAPRANLFNDEGKLIITHFAGPTWEANDGSRVVGTVVPGGSVTVDRTAVPWLLLAATPSHHGAAGGRLGRTTFVQRINTTGGIAPDAATCNAGTVGARAEVPYTADYLFWKRTG